MAAFKRSEWNAVIDEVNNVITNPPAGCTAQPAIKKVAPQNDLGEEPYS